MHRDCTVLCRLLLVLSVLPAAGCTQLGQRLSSGGRTPSPSAKSLTLVLVGDVMLGRGVAQALDGDWEAAFAGVRPWLGGPASNPGEAQSVVLANLESPLTTQPQTREGHDLRAAPAAVAALRAAGFDAVSVANNHALDAGELGLRETVRTVREAGIVPLLEGTPTPVRQALAVRVLALDDSVTPLDIGSAASAVAHAATQAEVVVVSIHWGGEYQAAPSARQQAIAGALAEAGASVIAGHGPHVLQRIEWVGETLVAYSLGNFLLDQLYPADCSWGAILHVTLRGARIVAVQAIPTVAEGGRVRRANAETAEAIVDRLELEMMLVGKVVSQ